jgi:hypothetical protein
MNSSAISRNSSFCGDISMIEEKDNKNLNILIPEIKNEYGQIY